ncbi:MAG: hypothetical protein GF344_07080 [Chitinivibrionales bacterium]|nr:hypothetical protein [Chitinivibrionales bacterium]MBD3356675.1 hypothetical protein [Chitinivibrionales bacterium]
MARLEWKKFVGQERVKETLKTAFDNDALGHAYLFSGAPGVGTLPAAVELATGLLCDGAEVRPCYECESCRLVRAHAHPDLNTVFPVELSREHRSGTKLSEAGWAYLAERALDKIRNPYVLDELSGLPQIPVEWIRELNHSVLRGASRGRWCVAILDGIETMNAESANAMLKTLEEPPTNTILILCTARPHAVLPTILSRCQILRFGHIKPECMTAALETMLDRSAEDTAIANAVRCAGGSLGKALALVAQPLDEQLGVARALLQLCAEEDWLRVAEGLEALVGGDLNQGRDYGAAERILTYVMYVVREGVVGSREGGQNYFSEVPAVHATAGTTDPEAARRMLDICQEAIGGVRARGNVMLVLTMFLIAMREVIHEQEQQPR